MTLFYGFGGYGLGAYDASEDFLVFDEVTAYYVGLLIVQYVNQPKARSTVGAYAREAVADSVYAAVRDGFSLDTAVGAQLDILATYRGASRVVVGLDLTRDYFAMPLYDDLNPEESHGFALYGETPAPFFLLYADAERPIYAMADDELRRLIRFRAATQSRFLSMKELDDILFSFFGANVQLVDNEDMTIDYLHDLGDVDPLFDVVEQTDSLPRPAGVAASVV